jgi:hypothetical protein
VPADVSSKLPPYDTILTSQILMNFVLSSRRQVLESHKLLLDLTQVIDIDVMLIFSNCSDPSEDKLPFITFSYNTAIK